jgi:hypothetical protein
MRGTRLGLACFIILSRALVLAADTPPLVEQPNDEGYIVVPSSPTPYQLRQMRRHNPKNIPLRRLEELPRKIRRKIQREIKKTSPNPNVQRPAFSPMPANAPAMPNLPTQAAPPATGAERFFAAAAKVMTKSWNGNIFVWLPAISTDPNAGPTYGILPVLVLSDPQTHHIRHLLAPSYTYNSLFGQTGTMRYYWYPNDSSQYVAIGSVSQHTNREAKVRYESTSLMEGILYVRGEAYYDVDGSRRFFGIGPESREGNQSGYTSRDTVARATAGINFFRYWRATFGARFRHMETEQNIIPDIPDMAVQFPTTPGLGNQNTVTGEFRLLWDSRDLPITPSRGSSGEFTVEKTNQPTGSDSDYLRYGLDGKRFFLWNNPNHVTVIHALYDKVNGENIPFYEMPSLGGRDTLRGYGDGRFIDRGRLVFNVEHRITFVSMEMMGIKTNFEVAPFFDLGSVFPDIQDIKSKDFRPVYGGAFRAAVKPNVVGDVEVGVGKEGPAVFVDINYPY